MRRFGLAIFVLSTLLFAVSASAIERPPVSCFDCDMLIPGFYADNQRLGELNQEAISIMSHMVDSHTVTAKEMSRLSAVISRFEYEKIMADHRLEKYDAWTYVELNAAVVKFHSLYYSHPKRGGGLIAKKMQHMVQTDLRVEVSYDWMFIIEMLILILVGIGVLVVGTIIIFRDKSWVGYALLIFGLFLTGFFGYMTYLMLR